MKFRIRQVGSRYFPEYESGWWIFKHWTSVPAWLPYTQQWLRYHTEVASEADALRNIEYFKKHRGTVVAPSERIIEVG